MRRGIKRLFISSMLLLCFAFPVKGKEIETEEHMGILVIENSASDGRIELSLGEELYHVNGDYYELEVPVGTSISLRAFSRPGRKVDTILANGIKLSHKEGECTLEMKEEFIILAFSYVERKDLGTVSGVPSGTENKEYHADGESSQDKISASDVTYDVKVTYLHRGEVQEEAVPEEIIEEDKAVLPDEISIHNRIETVEEIILPSNEDEEGPVVTVSEETVEASEPYDTGNTLELSGEFPEESPLENEENKQHTRVTKISASEPDNEKTASLETVKVTNSELSADPKGNSDDFSKKSVLFLSNLPLYLLAVCCMMILKQFIKSDKKG